MAEDIKFGTDGWRGIIAWDFTFGNVRRMAQALANWININTPSSLEPKTNLVVVGYDRRFLSDKFAEDIASILKLNKIDATLLDKPVTTPTISCLTTNKFWLGIMVTASHNKPQYNGIKIKIDGGSISTRLSKEIEECLDQKPVLYIPAHNVQTTKGMEKLYFKYCVSKVNMKKVLSLKGKIAVDYMNGSSTGYFEQILPPKQVIALREKHDPTFGGIAPEPKESVLGELKKTVTDKKCIMGVAFDGDGDRLAVIDETGKYLTPCIVSALVLDYLAKHKKLSGKVLQCLSMGYLNKRVARKYNLEFEEVPVGFKHIVERGVLEEIAFGAEESGGYCWKGVMPERDGLTLSLFLMEIIATSGKKLSQLVQDIAVNYGASNFMRKDINLVKNVDRHALAEKLRKKLPKKILGHAIAETLTFDGLKIILDNDDWLLIRPSGTEPMLRLYSETADKKQTAAFLDFGEKLISHLKL